jgi:hypothetical protein
MTAFVSLLAAVALIPSASTAKPRVWVGGNAPLTVRGSGFHAREHVRVTVSAKGLSGHRTLTARFVGTSLAEGCGTLVIRAAGLAGSRATFRSNLVDCAPIGPTD